MSIFLVDRAMDAPWAMLESNVEMLLAIAAGENEKTPEALAAYRENRKLGERAKVRDNVALLYAQGPMFKGANLLTDISGATSYEVLSRDLQAALNSTTIDAIMLCLDTPGGEAHGCDELAQAIFEARKIKPVEAYVSGFAASAGYWLASAADKITVSELSSLGSIGVVMGVADKKKAKESGVIEFVSSQSPHKRPDVETDAGRAKVQKFVDDMGAVFVSAVAKHRGVKVEHVLEKFGAGGMEVGANAVALGMADDVGQFEAALSRLSMRGKNSRFLKGKKMTTSTEASVDLAAATAAARTDERTRAGKITGHESFKSFAKLGSALLTADVSGDQAVAILEAAASDSKIAVDAAVEAAKKETQAPNKEKLFKEKHEDAGAIGFMPERMGADRAAAAADVWKKAKASRRATTN